MTVTNHYRIQTAITRLDSAIHHLEYLIDLREGQLNHGQVFDIKSALFDLRFTRTLLLNISYSEILLGGL